MDFTDLISRYSVDYTLIQKTKGGYVDGEYVAGAEIKADLRGAIVPLSTNKVYQSGGSYTTKDMHLYSSTFIDTADASIRHKDKEYQVQEDADYSAHTEVYVYLLKWVRNFDRSKTDK